MEKFDRADLLFEAGDYALAFSEFRRLAEEGSSSAMLRVASMLSAAMGTDYDLDEAIRWEKKAAELGDPIAFLNLGISYRCKGDLKRARESFELAYELDDPEAALELAKLYRVSDIESAKVHFYANKALSMGDLSESSVEEAKALLGLL